jgi:hypothetical protein
MFQTTSTERRAAGGDRPRSGGGSMRLCSTRRFNSVDASDGLHAISALAIAAGVTAVIVRVETTPLNHRYSDR